MENTKHPPTPTKEVNAKKLEIKEDLWKLKIGYSIFYLTISRYLKPYQTKILSFMFVLRSVMTIFCQILSKTTKKSRLFRKK